MNGEVDRNGANHKGANLQPQSVQFIERFTELPGVVDKTINNCPQRLKKSFAATLRACPELEFSNLFGDRLGNDDTIRTFPIRR